MSHLETLTLKNGTRVVLVQSHDTAAVTLLALYGVGSRHETLAQSGASHFIEHMMFKGTQRRPQTIAISRDLDGVGADYNAFTYKDHTGYYIRLQHEKLGLAVDMLEDMVYHSLYREKDVASERQVIFEELRMYDDNPMMVVEERMEEELYADSALGRRIGGTVETMTGITREALVKFRDQHYVPSNTVLALAGKFDRDAAVALLEKTFGAVKKRVQPKPFQKFSPAKRRGPALRVEFKETEQVQLAMGWPGLPYGHKDLAALKVMATILGGTMSSRLFIEVREKRGLAYSVHASVNSYQDVGNVTVAAGIAKERFAAALKVINAELRKLCDKPVSAAELSRAKEYIKGKTVLNLEDSSHMAGWYARQQLLQNAMETPEQRIEAVETVTRADVQRMAKATFVKAKLAAAIIGPYKDEKEVRNWLAA